MNDQKKKAVYVGRFNPIHAGHIKVIDNMLEQFGQDHSMIIVGSSNAPQSLRHFFSYDERTQFIKKLYPQIEACRIARLWR